MNIYGEAVKEALQRQLERDAKAKEDKLIQRRRDYMQGEQLGDNHEYWTGRQVTGEMKTVLDDIFTTNNKLKKPITDIRDGSLGKPPTFALVEDASSKNPQSTAEHEAINGSLQRWFKRRKIHKVLRKFALAYLWGGSAGFRVYIPDQNAQKLEQIRKNPHATLEDALKLIHIHALEAYQSGKLEDEHGTVLGYYYGYKADKEQRYELYLENETVLLDAQLEPIKDGDKERRTTNFLSDFSDGYEPEFLIYQAEREDGSLLSRTAMSLQDFMNVVATYMRLGVDFSAFRMMFFIDSDVPTDTFGRPLTLTMASGTAIALQRALKKRIIDPVTGAKVRGTTSPRAKQMEKLPQMVETVDGAPHVQVVDPVDPSIQSIPILKYLEYQLAAEFNQLYMQQASNASISGYSRNVARDPHRKMIIAEAEAFRDAMVEMIEKTVLLAHHIIRKAPPQFEVLAKLEVDVAQADLENFKVLLEAFAMDAISLRALVYANPFIEDKEEEIARLEQDIKTKEDRANYAAEQALKVAQQDGQLFNVDDLKRDETEAGTA